MTQMWEFLDRKFKITMLHRLRALMKNVDDMKRKKKNLKTKPNQTRTQR